MTRVAIANLVVMNGAEKVDVLLVAGRRRFCWAWRDWLGDAGLASAPVPFQHVFPYFKSHVVQHTICKREQHLQALLQHSAVHLQGTLF